jgi:SPP1 family predicted phage head-tail adaptor
MLPKRISTNASYTPIGALTSKIDLLKPTGRKDASGDPLPSDTWMQNLWAKIAPYRQKYTEKPETTTVEATYKITIRYVPGVSTDMIVQSEGKLYNIESVNDVQGNKAELELMCYLRNDGASGIPT